MLRWSWPILTLPWMRTPHQNNFPFYALHSEGSQSFLRSSDNETLTVAFISILGDTMALVNFDSALDEDNPIKIIFLFMHSGANDLKVFYDVLIMPFRTVTFISIPDSSMVLVTFDTALNEDNPIKIIFLFMPVQRGISKSFTMFW